MWRQVRNVLVLIIIAFVSHQYRDLMLRTFSTGVSKIFGGAMTTIGDNKSRLNFNPNAVHKIETDYEKATFGMGCFWGCDSLFGATYGILRTRVGYAGGTTPNPVYRNLGDHTEVIEVDYDPKKITFNQLLDIFWNNHEYGFTSKVKRQYMSLILYHNEEQKIIAIKSLREEQEKREPEKIRTEIARAAEFFPAEDYHQKYRLQSHKELSKSLGLNSDVIQTSHVAAKLNGYLVGVGGVKQFLSEAASLGLTNDQKDYVKYYVEQNEGGGLFC